MITPEDRQEIAIALQKVIDQLPDVSIGNHNNLCNVMQRVFGKHFTKKEAVSEAVRVLEYNATEIASGDIYIEELKQDIRREQQYMEMAENETL